MHRLVNDNYTDVFIDGKERCFHSFFRESVKRNGSSSNSMEIDFFSPKRWTKWKKLDSTDCSLSPPLPFYKAQLYYISTKCVSNFSLTDATKFSPYSRTLQPHRLQCTYQHLSPVTIRGDMPTSPLILTLLSNNPVEPVHLKKLFSRLGKKQSEPKSKKTEEGEQDFSPPLCNQQLPCY